MDTQIPDDTEGRLALALDEGMAALASDPANDDLLASVVRLLDLAGRAEEAEPLLLRCLEVAPDNLRALVQMGLLRRRQGRPGEALHYLAKAATLAPLAFDIAILAARQAIEARVHEEAEKICRQALAMAPDRHNACLLLGGLGTALLRQARAAEAVDAFSRAMAVDEQPTNHLLALSMAQAAAGDLEAARESARRRLAALDDQPDADDARAECLFQIVSSGRCDAALPDLPALRALAARVTEPSAAATHAHFALGKALTDMGELDAAFAEYARGNASRRAQGPFDLDAARREFAALKDAFDAAGIARLAAGGNTSDRPVFIVGMPRSGTTLVEQILARHPAIHGNGELDLMNDLARGWSPKAPALCAQAGYPAWTELPDAAAIVRLIAGYYLYGATRRAGNALHVTDKLPLNFRHVGLIAAAFPRAAIIHVRRNPLDTCLACHTTLFATGNGFTTDLATLGAYYREYHALMAHWRAVLPGRILDVDYEALVHAPETEARRMVDHLNLIWDDACLDYAGATPRAATGILTNSQATARQAPFTTSVGRSAAWRHHLGPLIDALGDLAG